MNYILNFLSAVFKVVVCTPPMRATAILSIYTKVIFNLMLKRTSESISSAFNRCIYIFFLLFSVNIMRSGLLEGERRVR